MFQKIKILEIFKNFNLRFFKTSLLSRQIAKIVQFHSGGDDYCPLLECEGLGGSIGNNPSNGFVFAWRDCIERKSQPGEKRIYAIRKDEETGEIDVVSEIYLKNDGTVEISGGKDLTVAINGNANFTVTGNTNLTTSGDTIINSTGSATFTGSVVNLGGDDGALVLTENSEIKDGEGRTCTITSNTSITKAV